MTLVERNFVQQISLQLIKQNKDDVSILMYKTIVDTIVEYFPRSFLSIVFLLDRVNSFVLHLFCKSTAMSLQNFNFHVW